MRWVGTHLDPTQACIGLPVNTQRQLSLLASAQPQHPPRAPPRPAAAGSRCRKSRPPRCPRTGGQCLVCAPGGRCRCARCRCAGSCGERAGKQAGGEVSSNSYRERSSLVGCDGTQLQLRLVATHPTGSHLWWCPAIATSTPYRSSRFPSASCSCSSEMEVNKREVVSKQALR